MVFSSLFFLYAFLPLTVLLYFAVPLRYRNHILLTASLFFYAWGEMAYVLLMMVSILVNWLVGLAIERDKQNDLPAKRFLVLGVVLNLLPLAFFKYGNFVIDNFYQLTAGLGVNPIDFPQIHLPIGISFFTFQAISYIVDIYREEAVVQKKLVNLALYISLFPQLIAGPIVRYHDIARAINHRVTRMQDISDGILRFITGLGKKVLIANNMGAVADIIFALPMENVSTGLAWIGIIAYTLQIYFDFSGYSDMAIGLGRIFGFKFLENFNYPYAARSIQDFWRRWHISLSSWFRDYVYIPLGGSRVGLSRTSFNLVLVFFLCGLWHGASWTFVLWGLYHGLFLVLERSAWGRLLARLPAFLAHTYTLFVVIIGWVLFRAETLDQALAYMGRLFAFESVDYLDAYLFARLNVQFYIALAAGVILSFPWVRDGFRFLDARLFGSSAQSSSKPSLWLATSKSLALGAWIFLISAVCAAQLAIGGYNPFLYFRF